MKDTLKATYKLYEEKLQELFNQVADTKKMLNMLAKDMGESIPYEEVAPEGVGGAAKVKPDQFFNQPLATAVREYLKLRKSAVEWAEIVRALREGGFDLAKTRQAEDEARMTILRNTANFVLVGNNNFGLKSWYPERREKASADEGGKAKKGKKGQTKDAKNDNLEANKEKTSE